MKYCEHCKVHVKGNRIDCPLCDNTLIGTESEDVFPIIPSTYRYNLILRIMLFLTITISALSISIQLMFPINLNWPLFVIVGMVCIWISLYLVMKQRHNIPKSIVWQVNVIIIFAILWDLWMGWNGWSIEYVLPISYVVAMIVMIITAYVMKLNMKDYIIYILLDGVFGFVPIIFLCFGIIEFIYPSIICATLSVISLSAFILFKGEEIKDELNRRMHL